MSVNLLPLVMVVFSGEICLTLPVLPWHSMVAARCQEPLKVISFGASSIPHLQRIYRCLPNDLGKALCAFVLRAVCKLWTSSHSPVDFRIHDICSDCFSPASRGPDSSWDSRRVLHKSPSERVRPSCSLKSRVLSSIHHGVLNIGLSTVHLSSSPSHSQRFVSSTTRS